LSGVLAPIILRGGDAAAGFDLDAHIQHRHFGARNRPEQHQLVEIAEVADTEQLAGHFRQAGAQGQVVALERTRNHVRTVDALGHHDRRHRV